jgi:hypothetical protein
MRWLWCWFALVASVENALGAPGCPFCPPSQPTLSEKVAESDMVVLVQWVESQSDPNDPDAGAKTVFQVVDPWRVAKNSQGKTWKKDDLLEWPFLRTGKKGDLFLMFGRWQEEKPAWDLPVEISEISFQYVRQAPSPEQTGPERLKYFLRFLEFSDPLLAGDAFSEFSKAPYEDVAALAESLPRAKLRGWLEASETSPVRRGFYGMLLGLCGNEDDAKFLESQVLSRPAADEVRLGHDGMMGGYLLLRKEPALQKLVKAKLGDPSLPTGELYAFLNALRFMWQYGQDRIPAAEQQAALRGFLDREDMAEVVLSDLARAKDWSVLERLTTAYGKSPFETSSAKRRIVQLVLACAKDLAETPEAENARQAKVFLDRIRREEPAVLKAAQSPF